MRDGNAGPPAAVGIAATVLRDELQIYCELPKEAGLIAMSLRGGRHAIMTWGSPLPSRAPVASLSQT